MLQQYLQPSEYIDFLSPAVTSKARQFAIQSSSVFEIIKQSFEFVRDGIKHSSDFKMNPVTCRASDVLEHETGYCYAKSHLLAALLRANGIPTGLCYQRLSVSGSGAPFCLHGLNAIHLDSYGWYRVDARGNKPGVNSQFCPPTEQLAFPILAQEERDLPEIWPEPLPVIIDTLTKFSTYDQVYVNLPDVEVLI